MDLVGNVKEACRRQGITVSEMEKHAGLAENSVYKWNRNSPSVTKVAAAANVLQISIDELVNGSGRQG